MTSKNNSKNAGQAQDLLKRSFRITPDNDALINDKSTKHELSRAELIRHCLDFCEANTQALDAFITNIVGSAETDTDNAESTDSADNVEVQADKHEPAMPTPGTPLVHNKHLNSLILGELNASSRNLERFAHTAQQNRLNSVALQSMDISNRLKHIRDVLENK